MSIHDNKVLLITFPVDLGNKTIEANLHEIFRDDMLFYRFAAQNAHKLEKGVSYKRSVKDRLLSVLPLCLRVLRARNRKEFVLFNGLSPAFLSLCLWNSKRTAIVFDWTRLLYPSVLGQELNKGLLFKLHRFVLKRCKVILCWTDAIKDNLIDHYDVDPNRLIKVPAPFMVKKLDIPPRKTPSIPRVLFVGGDLKRKGGDVLLSSFERKLRDKCELTMVTGDPSANVAGITCFNNIRYGTPEHRNVYESNDILILPTRIDAYPQVIGEAAAAGLAVITTKFALGAKEVVIERESGFITDTPEQTVEKLLYMLENPECIDEFKTRGYEHMHNKFSESNIRKSYLNALSNE